MLENSELFNAGKGSVLSNDEIVEMDASIMTGSDLNAGAVATLKTIKNPISAARAVMEKSKHVFLSGEGAENFAVDNGLETVNNIISKLKETNYESLSRKIFFDVEFK